MKKTISKLLLFFFCMSFLMVIPKKVNAAEIIPVNIPVKYGQTEARKIFDMINEMRTNSSDAWYWNSDNTTKTICNNLSKLSYDYDLEKLAMKRAAEIALSYGHTRPNGEGPFSIYTEAGITYSAAGENIAVGYSSAKIVNTIWREDDDDYSGQGHRRNMLNSKYNCVGIGHVYYNGYHYWVEEFARRTSVNTTQTAANDNEQTTTVSVDKSTITNIKVTFDKTSYILQTGETAEPNITARITVSGQWLRGDGIVKDIPTISVVDPSVATYNNGIITGITEGTTTLTASLYGLPAADMPTITVQKSDNPRNQTEITKNTIQKTTKKIKLNRRKLTLKKGKTFKLKVTLIPKDSRNKIIYKTSNKKVARISKNGKIKALKKGKASITVISGNKKIICKVTVK